MIKTIKKQEKKRSFIMLLKNEFIMQFNFFGGYELNVFVFKDLGEVPGEFFQRLKLLWFLLIHRVKNTTAAHKFHRLS